mmetsp:Transcript_42707/g.105238  ORF Transcript_42707/g.105238 Transcript_42707/m.105238 type:complete len:149 (-) Transcript_42707:169-615(-)
MAAEQGLAVPAALEACMRLVVPFAGQGRSQLPSARSSGRSQLPSTRSSGRSSAQPSALPIAAMAAVADESLPTTCVQVRLKDNKKHEVELNHTHTVGELRAHVATLVLPGERFERFDLHFLSKIGTCDDDKTIEEAGLLRANIHVDYS